MTKVTFHTDNKALNKTLFVLTHTQAQPGQ